MKCMDRWSRMDLEFGSIPWAAADRVKVQGIFAGLDLVGFDCSTSTVGVHLLTSAPIQSIACWLLPMGMHCNSTPGVTSLHCVSVLSEPNHQHPHCFRNKALAAVLSQHLVHNPFSPLVHVTHWHSKQGVQGVGTLLNTTDDGARPP